MKVRLLLASLIFLTICTAREGKQETVRFVRYFASEKEFIAGLPLPATERFKRSYLQVFYNQKKQPLLKEWLDPEGTITRRERLEYDDKDRLIRRYRFGSEGYVKELIQYGAGEPWGIEFRKVLVKSNQHIDFQGSRSVFELGPDFEIQSVKFLLVDGTPYGAIDFVYDHLGFLVGENWIRLPDSLVIRRFAYGYDLVSGKREIWEYDASGQEVSHVALVQAPADQLYKRPPPPRGNRLDELAVLLEDIQSHPLRIPFDVFIPKYEHDRLQLTNGDRLQIDVIRLETNRLIFRLADSPDTLTMPLSRVTSIISKYDEALYP